MRRYIILFLLWMEWTTCRRYRAVLCCAVREAINRPVCSERLLRIVCMRGPSLCRPCVHVVAFGPRAGQCIHDQTTSSPRYYCGLVFFPASTSPSVTTRLVPYRLMTRRHMGAATAATQHRSKSAQDKTTRRLKIRLHCLSRARSHTWPASALPHCVCIQVQSEGGSLNDLGTSRRLALRPYSSTACAPQPHLKPLAKSRVKRPPCPTPPPIHMSPSIHLPSTTRPSLQTPSFDGLQACQTTLGSHRHAPRRDMARPDWMRAITTRGQRSVSDADRL